MHHSFSLAQIPQMMGKTLDVSLSKAYFGCSAKMISTVCNKAY